MGENVRQRRSSLASSKRMTLHLQHLADVHGVAPDADDRPPEARTRSYAPVVGSDRSVASMKPVVEEPVSIYHFIFKLDSWQCPP